MDINIQNIDSRIFRVRSSDDSDSDDDTLKKVLRHDDSDLEQDGSSVSAQNGLGKVVKPSKKLEIVGQHKNTNKKFSIWSEILLEEELSESMDNACKLKTRSRKRKKPEMEKESDNYFSWSKEDFERKFGANNGNVAKRQKKEPATEIANQLGEPRVDIIRRIVEVLGEQVTRRLAAEVMDIESVGGMMTNDGTRKRSPGGLLFYLIKNDAAIDNEQKAAIFCDTLVKQRNREVKKSKRIKKNNIKGKKKKKKKNKKKK